MAAVLLGACALVGVILPGLGDVQITSAGVVVMYVGTFVVLTAVATRTYVVLRRAGMQLRHAIPVAVAALPVTVALLGALVWAIVELAS